MLKLKLQFFDHLMPRANLLEKTLDPRQKEKWSAKNELVR